VKTLDLAVSTMVMQCVVTLLEASSWSPGWTQFRANVLDGKFVFL
jgi:hypothetical protein